MKKLQKILSESVNSRLKDRLIKMGPSKASKMGFDIQDYINLVYNGDITQYVSEHLNELLHLTPKKEYGTKAIVFYPIKDTRLFVATKPIYSPTKEYNLLLMDSTSMFFIEDFLTKEIFIQFMNEFYNLDITKLYIR